MQYTVATVQEARELLKSALKENKYKNIRETVDGIKFDSTIEAKRYRQLKNLQIAGLIKNLRIHPRYPIADGITYEADFDYEDVERKVPLVVEDVKGVRTKEYKIKIKLFKAKYPYLKFVELDNDSV